MNIHLIAIGGSAMHNLALALHEMGHRVTGSDDEIFEPSRSRLERQGLLPSTMGWDPEHIQSSLDCVILGMHARRNNPELLRAQELELPVYSYPEFIYQQSRDKTRVVIAGSHGKTTITAMVLHVLHYHQRECDFLVGAQLEGFDTMVKLTEHNDFILLEGDEYLSSPLDSRPKFLHYQPNIALLSGIAWDHFNVFPRYEQYYAQFEALLQSVDMGGAVVYNSSDPEVRRCLEETTNEVKKFAYDYPAYQVQEGQYSLETPEGEVPLQIIGRHNMNNLEGARLIANQMGVTDDEFYEAIAEFQGASLRLECLLEKPQLRIYRDYAHAPSKVRATTEGLREAYPEASLVACLELHTYSSLNAEFLPHYQGALEAADQALIYFNPEVVAHKKLPTLTVDKVKEAFGSSAITVVNSSEEVLTWLDKHLEAPATGLIMSSGNFDGIEWPDQVKRWDL